MTTIAKTHKQKSICVIAILLAVAWTTVERAHAINVFVSIQPQAEFVEQVGGKHVNVNVLVQPGESPATYSPTTRQMIKLSRADVFFRIGVPFEKALMPKIEKKFPKLKIVDLRDTLQLRRMITHHHHSHHKDKAAHYKNHDHDEHKTHGHNDHETHDHAQERRVGGLDPHTWLDPDNVIKMLEVIARTLGEINAKHADVFQQNAKTFQQQLKTLDTKLAQTLEPLKGHKLFVFHPAYGYFADAYGLQQMAVEIEGKDPSARQLTRLIDKAKQENVKVIFVQPQFSQKSARVIASKLNAAVVPLDPLAKDYIANMEKIAEKVKEALH